MSFRIPLIPLKESFHGHPNKASNQLLTHDPIYFFTHMYYYFFFLLIICLPNNINSSYHVVGDIIFFECENKMVLILYVKCLRSLADGKIHSAWQKGYHRGNNTSWILTMFIMQNRVKGLWAEGKEEILCRRNCKKSGNKGVMYSEVASISLRVLWKEGAWDKGGQAG